MPFYLARRMYDLGPHGLINVLKRRLKNRLWILRKRKAALTKNAASTWKKIQRTTGYTESFEIFFHNTLQDSYIQTVFQSPTFQSFLPKKYSDRQSLVVATEKIVAHIHDLLGSGEINLGSPINWHADFKKQNLREPFTHPNRTFSYETQKEIFHTQIAVPQLNPNPHTYNEDVKVLWDLSRMHHLTTLACAYTATPDEKYAHSFINNITSWLDQNPYLLGANWKCPMDVGIRAINLVWAFHFFKNSPSTSAAFWQRYVENLFDHFEYLTWNFEESDKPNNHLLADYVGYLYLCAFFRNMPFFKKKLSHAQKLLEKEFHHQILPDGSAYEGSTAYHRLDCEMLLHVTEVLKALEIPSLKLVSLLEKMLSFLADCTDNGGTLIRIGDEDDGKIVFGMEPARRKPVRPVFVYNYAWRKTRPGIAGSDDGERFFQNLPQGERVGENLSVPNSNLPSEVDEEEAAKGTDKIEIETPLALRSDLIASRMGLLRAEGATIKTYSNFGLGIIRTDTLHATLRATPATHKRPTGHVHHDGLAATLSVGKDQLIVDPGSFVYTANRWWRNFFRSGQCHSTFFMEKEKDPRDKDLFQTTVFYSEGSLKKIPGGLEASQLHPPTGWIFSRKIFVTDKTITLIDKIIVTHTSPTQENITWQLIFHPTIQIKPEQTGYGLFKADNKIAHLESTLVLAIDPEKAYSSAYGAFEKTTGLAARITVSASIEHTTTIVL